MDLLSRISARRLSREPGFLDSGSVSAIIEPCSTGNTPSLPWSNEAVGLNDCEVISKFKYFTVLD